MPVDVKAKHYIRRYGICALVVMISTLSFVTLCFSSVYKIYCSWMMSGNVDFLQFRLGLINGSLRKHVLIELIYENEAIIRLSIFLGGFVLLAIWEQLLPIRGLNYSKAGRWTANISLVICSTVLIRIVLPTAVVGAAYITEQEHWGLANHFDFPLWVKVIFTFILLDFSIYIQHLVFHVLPVMWRFHRVHHSDLDCDVSTGLRFHPVEILISLVFKIIIVVLIGAPVIAVILFEIVLNIMSMFTHSNVRLNKYFEQVLRWLIVTPYMHRVHHSIKENETNSNFGFHLSVWDRIFGTYLSQPSAGFDGMTIGLNSFREQQWQGIKGLMIMPFAANISGYAINYRDTLNADEFASVKSLVKERTKKLNEEKEISERKSVELEGVVNKLVESESYQRLLLDSMVDGFVTADTDGVILSFNTSAEKIFGYKASEVVGKNVSILMPSVVANYHDAYIGMYLTKDENHVVGINREIEGKRKDGSVFPVEIALNVAQIDHKKVFSAVVRDITKRKKSEDALRESRENEFRSQEKIRLAAELTVYLKAIDKQALVSATDASGVIIKANEKFCEVSGYTQEELLGQDHRMINSGVHSKSFFKGLWETICAGNVWQGEVCNRSKGGSLFWVDTTIVPLKGDDGEIERFISVRLDVTERKRNEADLEKAYEDLSAANVRLEELSRTDSMTGLANRRSFDETLLSEIKKSQRTSLPVTLILCDIDYFKKFNDTYGHQAGDSCLQKVANTIKSCFSRTGDLVARYGGEEFAIILLNVDHETAMILAERMRNKVEGLKIEHDTPDEGNIVTISAGVTSLVPDRKTSPEQLIEHADRALYLAKEKGRNNVQYSES